MSFLILYLSGGLFLGWSLGANDASNVFGTAVEAKMIRFKTAALISALFVIIGATFFGHGTTGTLEKLALITQLSDALLITLASALSVFLMTKSGLPVSTSQAIVGALIGFNLYYGKATDIKVLEKIVLSWVLCPVLAALFSGCLFFIIRGVLKRIQVHILSLDKTTRIALLAAGAFGSFSLGANNIANVMGVFVQAVSLNNLSLGKWVFYPSHQLFFIGSVAIGVGIITYSKKVMKTVGNEIYKLSPVTAFIAVLSHSLVLFIFASTHLRAILLENGLWALPLVPVSSSQAIVGAVMGIGIVKTAGRNINYAILGKIALGWALTPVLAGIMTCFLIFLITTL